MRLSPCLIMVVLCAACSVPSVGAPPASAPAAPQAASPSTARPAGVVEFKVTGTGTAITIDYDPSAPGVLGRESSVRLPWSKQVPDPGQTSYQVVVVGGRDVGCQILIDGKVVAREPTGGSAHCTYVS